MSRFLTGLDHEISLVLIFVVFLVMGATILSLVLRYFLPYDAVH